MKRADDSRRYTGGAGERGGGRLNLVIVLALLAVVGYSAYQYAPVAYRASLYKVYMEDTVNKAAATGQTTDWLREQLRKGGEEYGVPPDATIEVTKKTSAVEAHVRWTRPVPLPFYVYQYSFDHTVKSSSFLMPN
jgi:hypothetical protein